MTDKLPPNLLALFAPRPPLRWVPPSDWAPEQRKTAAVGGVAEFLPALAEYEREYEYHPTESWLEARDRKKLEKKAAIEKLLTEGPKNYKPSEDPNIRGDAFKTLIVARLDYKADEQDLEREFGRFGPIERIRIITDTHADEKGNKKRKPHRGYAFVVFEREKDMRGNIATPDSPYITTQNPSALGCMLPDLWPSSLPVLRNLVAHFFPPSLPTCYNQLQCLGR
ncbi:U1 small nuclear ribonucleoprotein of 70kDa MW N terminal-domain-containing protein [Cercophora scortea]|uniref:U1 small nuclear ribonucleoprotein of 70kDa MW N terminal-domain-containing protein n=1 Tax=Cercophora scortea TaxID=314031 RepID=A0AAE0IYB1_9PEZI|nr:U1 small nuclear ribonucleoprotein of 70kDa MW N terminal-domain-containing protein [Cercophora scortea]